MRRLILRLLLRSSLWSKLPFWKENEMRDDDEIRVRIDYGLGRSNVDLETGIRYGVIPSNVIAEFFLDEFEPDYGEPTCPKCGNEAELTMNRQWRIPPDGEYWCAKCE